MSSITTPKIANIAADAYRNTSGRSRFPIAIPATAPIIPAATSPPVAPSHVATGWPRAASVAVASCVLSPNSASAIVIAIDAITDERANDSCRLVGGRLAEGQDREHEKHDPAADRQRPVGQRRTEQAADEGSDRPRGREAEREADKYHAERIAGAEVEGQQLGLVAQLGHEHDAERDEDRAEELHGDASSQRNRGSRRFPAASRGT